MRDFQGLETADKPTKQAMMEFSYHLSVGNMDEAFKAIKTIKRWARAGGQSGRTGRCGGVDGWGLGWGLGGLGVRVPGRGRVGKIILGRGGGGVRKPV